MIDKAYCLSSFMAFRYNYRKDTDYFEGMRHASLKLLAPEECLQVKSSQEIDAGIREQFAALYQRFDNIGILLSGGMDSAILASYLKPGSHAFTFTSSYAGVFDQDFERARLYCKKFGLRHHRVEIVFGDFLENTRTLMRRKCAPVHSIEPQIFKAAFTAKQLGVQLMIIGNAADYIFGGMDKLLSQDWTYPSFVRRYTFLDPSRVLRESSDRIYEVFEPFRIEKDGIDFVSFLQGPSAEESYNSYWNAFLTADLPYRDPYEMMRMKNPLDLDRVRRGESKYLIRGLYAMKYPEIRVPEKIPMPRPVDKMFENWAGPRRKEFKAGIDMSTLSGNQKWQLWCAEQFLDMYDS